MFLTMFWRKFTRKSSSFSSFFALFLLAFYRSFLSGTLGSGGACRFYPSCSEYAFLAYKNYSFLKATVLVFQRLLDCHPFGPKVRIEPDFSKDRAPSVRRKTDEFFEKIKKKRTKDAR